MWVFFATIWGLILYDGIKSWEPEWEILIMIIIWLLVFIVCIKWYISLLKKKKIKKNKEFMKRIDATVTWFERRGADRHHTPTSYYFIASNWIENYNSEEFDGANIIWFTWNIWQMLKLMNITYNPDDKDSTIKTLNNKLNEIEATKKQYEWLRAMMFDREYNLIKQAKEELENWNHTYMEFKWHKLSVGDKVNVYIDPENPENYWIDTDFLYQI